MFCPRCGQQQVVEEVRFCPRCGFTLVFVAELLANGGMMPSHLVPAGAPAGELSPKRQGVRQGGKMMIFGAALIPVLAILGAASGMGGEMGLLGVILFILGLARMLYAAIFQEGYQAAQHAAPALPQQPAAPAFQPAQPRAVLPQHQTPAPVSFRRRDTAELVAPPPSVTENTTRLLDDQRDAPDR